MSNPTKSPPAKSTCSQESADSPTPPVSPECPMTSTSGPGDSRARILAPQEKEQDCLDKDQACSLRLFGCCVASDSDRLGCSLRMSLLSSAEAMTGLKLNWSLSATPSGHRWWVLGRLARPTGGTGCGSLDTWATPQVFDMQTELVRSPEKIMETRQRGNGAGVRNLREQVHYPEMDCSRKHWQTPNAMAGGNKSRGGERKGELLLAGQVKAERDWPTPRASENENRTTKPAPSHGKGHGKVLAGEVHGQAAQASPNSTGKPRGCLNSRWVASLMGYPPDWCDVPTKTP